ncbi:hypothetical protein GQ457_01G033410 [Hibiscus cannabinus]
MASSRPQFQMGVEHCLAPNKAPHLPNLEFLLHIRTSLRDRNGLLREDPWQRDTQEFQVLPESVFGSQQHHNNVSRRLREAGWLHRGHRELVLDLAFELSNSIISKEKEEKKKKKNHNYIGSDDIVRIIFRSISGLSLVGSGAVGGLLVAVGRHRLLPVVALCSQKLRKPIFRFIFIFKSESTFGFLKNPPKKRRSKHFLIYPCQYRRWIRSPPKAFHSSDRQIKVPNFLLLKRG